MTQLQQAVAEWTKAKVRESELLLQDDWSRIPPTEFSRRHGEVIAATVPLLHLGLHLLTDPEPAPRMVRVYLDGKGVVEMAA